MSTQSDWISVKDRLPKEGPIWAYTGRNIELWLLKYAPSTFTEYHVTHWMPATLPDPPKSEAEIALSAAWAAKPGWGASDYSSFKSGFLSGWQACEKRGEG